MKHPALLDWEDVQVLVRLCSVSIPQDRVETRAFEAARRDLVDAVLVYLKEWLPAQMIEDEARVPLISALTAYAQACHSLEVSGGEMPRGSIPVQGAIDQCTRLCMLLVRAMEGEGPDAP